MKNFLCLIVLSLILIASFGSVVSANTRAITPTSLEGKEVTVQNYSRYISLDITYNEGSVPTTYNYKRNGYSGTLYLQFIHDIPGNRMGHYEGWVTCYTNHCMVY
ncbi:hypothetical protein OBCHQ24_03670 [Oceanobacillus iheyensis]|nr:hypothetical protein OBCHQ24_03670 [Oceanobacillus iheyensis]